MSFSARKVREGEVRSNGIDLPGEATGGEYGKGYRSRSLAFFATRLFFLFPLPRAYPAPSMHEAGNPRQV